MEPRHFRLLGAQRESEAFFQQLLHHCQGLFRLRLAAAEHHKVIGVPHKAEAELVEMPVEHVQSDVGQKRRCDPALGRTDSRRQELAIS